jgi:hypothetical protein
MLIVMLTLMLSLANIEMWGPKSPLISPDGYIIRGSVVVATLNHLPTTVETVRGYVVTTVRFPAGGIHRQGRSRKTIVGPAHAAA